MNTTQISLPEVDVQREFDEHLAESARRSLDPSDVLAVVQHLLLEITDDAQHPLWRLVVEATRDGTARESGVMPRAAEFVGAALMPYLDKALSRLVSERLLMD